MHKTSQESNYLFHTKYLLLKLLMSVQFAYLQVDTDKIILRAVIYYPIGQHDWCSLSSRILKANIFCSFPIMHSLFYDGTYSNNIVKKK